MELKLERGSNKVEVIFLAGDTELKVQARQCGTNNLIQATFNFLR